MRMATIPQTGLTEPQMMDEAASKMAHLLEEHFDEKGWSEDERNRRVSEASAAVAIAVAHHAKSS